MLHFIDLDTTNPSDNHLKRFAEKKSIAFEVLNQAGPSGHPIVRFIGELSDLYALCKTVFCDTYLSRLIKPLNP
jgi:hypothetical protein